MVEREAGAPIRGPFGKTKRESVFRNKVVSGCSAEPHPGMEGNFLLVSWSQKTVRRNNILLRVKGRNHLIQAGISRLQTTLSLCITRKCSLHDEGTSSDIRLTRVMATRNITLCMKEECPRWVHMAVSVAKKKTDSDPFKGTNRGSYMGNVEKKR